MDRTPEESAAAANLYYMTDDTPGFQRKKRGRGFAYYDTQGQLIRDPDVKERIRKLVIPPAYTQVWICPDPLGHLQATGFNEAGKKQYLYHPRWRQVRDETKYEQMIRFGEQLPTIRRRVQADLKQPDLSQEKVLAAVVKLLDKTHIRIGNQAYATENDSYGLTTLRKKHVDTAEDHVTFEFTGKAGKDWEVTIEDEQLIDVIRRCESIPGYQLFKYFDDTGAKQSVSSGEVNQYLKKLCDYEVTAKYFRTWAATVYAVELLGQQSATTDQKVAEQNVTEMVKAVAERLGNTPAICRNCYIHPAVIDLYVNDRAAFPTKNDTDQEQRSFAGADVDVDINDAHDSRQKPYLSEVEARTLSLLQQFVRSE